MSKLCQECGHIFEKTNLSCPECGATSLSEAQISDSTEKQEAIIEETNLIYEKDNRDRKHIYLGIVIVFFIIAIGIYFFFFSHKSTVVQMPINAGNIEIPEPLPQKTLDDFSFKQSYYVTKKTFFYDTPSEKTIRKGYLVEGDVLNVYKEEEGYLYVKFYNSKGILSEGWINKDDLMVIDKHFVDKYGVAAIINDKDGYTNVRETPNTSSIVLYRILENTTFYILETQNKSWYKVISYENNPVGWIHKSRVKIFD